MIDYIRGIIIFVALCAACTMVLSRQPMRAVLSLYVVMVATAMLWMTMSQEYLAYILLIMHAGALMTMFLFVTMTVASVRDDTRHYGIVYAVALCLTALWVVLLWSVLPPHADIPLPLSGVVGSMGVLWVSTYGGSLWLLGTMLTLGMIACVKIIQPVAGDTLRRQNVTEQVSTQYGQRLQWKTISHPPSDGVS